MCHQLASLCSVLRRVVLGEIRDRLWHTRQVLQQCLVNPSINVKQALNDGEHLQPCVAAGPATCMHA